VNGAPIAARLVTSVRPDNPPKSADKEILKQMRFSPSMPSAKQN
jgi:hypothetical protein